jgi:hypothetical protein
VIYTKIFGGSTIQPTDVSYAAYALAGTGVTLVWPLDAPASANVAAAVIDVNSSGPGAATVTMPDARQASNGEAVLFNNVGVAALTVQSATGATLLSAPAGTAWQLYLTDNATQTGVWRAIQFGATTGTANAAALAGDGLTAIASVLAQNAPVTTAAASFTMATTDRADAIVWSGGAGVVTLPLAATLGNGWFVSLRNSGSGVLVVQPSGGQLINATASLSLSPGDSCDIVCGGTAFFTYGLGPAITNNFSFLSIDVSGTGDYVLSAAEQNRVAYRLTGTLTGARTIVVPTTQQQYWFDNSTTGAFALTARTVSQAPPGVSLPASTRQILYSDGNDMKLADTSVSTFPITIAQGGTGATTASAALIALGGTTVGRQVFTAGTQAAARAAIDAPSVADAIAFAVALG